MKRTTIIETIIFLYSALFLYTGLSKLLEFDTFKEQLIESPLFGKIGPLIAFTLPWLEFAIVLMLLIPRWRYKGLFAAISLMVVFTSYIVIILLSAKKLPCSCGGIIGELTWPQHLILNVAYIILGLWALRLQKKHTIDINRIWESSHHSRKVVSGL